MINAAKKRMTAIKRNMNGKNRGKEASIMIKPIFSSRLGSFPVMLVAVKARDRNSSARWGCIQPTLLGNNSIMSRASPSGLCHGLPGKVRENRRVVDEPRLNRRLCQYSLPPLHLPHHASSNDYHGDRCWGPRHLHVQDYEYCNSGCSVLLGLYKPDLIICRAYVQVCQASFPSRQRQTSTATRSGPEIA